MKAPPISGCCSASRTTRRFMSGGGWKPFDGEIFCEQPQGRVRFEAMAPYVYHLKRAPPTGVIDLCGLPW